LLRKISSLEHVQSRQATSLGGDDPRHPRGTARHPARGRVRPKNTPAEIVNKLNKEINAGLADPKVKARLADLGGTPFALSPADFGQFIAEETEKWGKVIRAANIKPE